MNASCLIWHNGFWQLAIGLHCDRCHCCRTASSVCIASGHMVDASEFESGRYIGISPVFAHQANLTVIYMASLVSMFLADICQ